MALAAAATSDPDAWGPLAFTSTPLAPVVDSQTLCHAPLLPFPKAAAHIDLLLGYCKDEYAAFTATLPGLKQEPEVFVSAVGFPQVSFHKGSGPLAFVYSMSATGKPTAGHQDRCVCTRLPLRQGSRGIWFCFELLNEQVA